MWHSSKEEIRKIRSEAIVKVTMDKNFFEVEKEFKKAAQKICLLGKNN